MYLIQWNILASSLKIVEVSKILSLLFEPTNVVLFGRDDYYAVAVTYEVSKKILLISNIFQTNSTHASTLKIVEVSLKKYLSNPLPN